MLVMLVTLLKIMLATLAVVSILVISLVSVYRNNRLFFICLLGAFFSHLFVAGGLLTVQKILEAKPLQEARVTIMMPPKPKPEKIKIEPPKPVELPKTLDIPKGRMDGNPKAKTMPKGNPKPSTPRDPGRPMVSNVSDQGEVFVDEKDTGPLQDSLDDVINRRDVATLANGTGGTEGDPNGQGTGDVPRGFPDGKVGGRVYFIRLKHGSGAWNAYNDGTTRLLSFLNNYFPCASDTWPMTSAELRDRYMNKGAYPTFIYMYCDETFALSQTDVTVLHDYMTKANGFLFLDSRPDPAIMDHIAAELEKVISGSRLQPLSNSHPINSFLFKLNSPGVGENVVTMKNYGVSKNGHLVVFYTMGNFAHLYSANAPDAFEYITAQYQMGANVMLYAIRKGDPSAVRQEKGVSAKITNNALQQLGFLDAGSPGTEKPGEKKPDESVKVKPAPIKLPDGSIAPPTDGSDQGPDEIKVLDTK